MVPLLSRQDPLPPPTMARDDMNGLLAVGGGLEAERLLNAYHQGIFPWGTVEGHPLWYSPNPRMVLLPDEFRLSRSLRKLLRQNRLTVAFDTCFQEVMFACATTPRPGQDGSWINNEMISAYVRLHELGWAHSVEVFQEGELVGGLYGLAIGRMFYGESMFSRRDKASKFAFAYLIGFLRQHDFGMIDCQMYTEHLASLGGREIPRDEFIARMNTLTPGAVPCRWSSDSLHIDW